MEDFPEEQRTSTKRSKSGFGEVEDEDCTYHWVAVSNHHTHVEKLLNPTWTYLPILSETTPNDPYP